MADFTSGPDHPQPLPASVKLIRWPAGLKVERGSCAFKAGFPRPDQTPTGRNSRRCLRTSPL
jgi:hypothetical protein